MAVSRYVSTGKPRGWIADPVKRHQRAVKAGEASRLARLKQAYERAGRLHPIEAYANGYRAGYQRGYAYWKAKLKKLEARAA